MSNNIQTFIFVHDQDIILDFIEKKRFSEFENFKWVFLGDKEINKVKHLDNFICCRKLSDNIEKYKNLTSFTGWYSLYKNNLIDCEYVNLFEYDINYVRGFVDINKEMIKKHFDFIGYVPIPMSDPNYLKFTKFSDKLIDSILNRTNVNVYDLVNSLNPNSVWSSSSNSTWKSSVLFDYMEWFIQFLDDINESEFAGHMHERSISFYYLIKNIYVFLEKNLIEHFQLNSHDTSGFLQDRHKLLYDKLV